MNKTQPDVESFRVGIRLMMEAIKDEDEFLSDPTLLGRGEKCLDFFVALPQYQILAWTVAQTFAEQRDVRMIQGGVLGLVAKVFETGWRSGRQETMDLAISNLAPGGKQE